jgi:cytochrome P450
MASKGRRCRAVGIDFGVATRSSASVAAEGVAKIAPSSKKEYPALRHVRKFPLIGSVIPRLSGIPNSIRDPYRFFPEMRSLYGDFYTLGLPALGNRDCWYRTLYVITDPEEMVKVVRGGGSYPSGIVENLWVNKKWNRTRGLKTGALLESGKEWKRIRTFMQTDLMHPASARGYVPGMIQAAELASKGAPAMSRCLNHYLNLCAFDLFSTIMFGELTQTADPAAPKDPENVRFVTNAVEGLSTALELFREPYEIIMDKLGYQTPKLRRAFHCFDTIWEIVQNKTMQFAKRKQNNQLTENERVSYLARAMDRQQQQEQQHGDEAPISTEEVHELALSSLTAAVDTTSTVIGWNLFNLARFPHVQDKLYQHLVRAVHAVGHPEGRLTTEVLDRKHVPYLHAVIRETQRMTPIGAGYIVKTLAEDHVQINGVPLNKGDVVMLEGFSIQMDPNIVDSPHEFLPERWLPDAVNKRKGTKSEIIDHPYFKEPFSQGARRCPGSRVAINEVQVMISQLFLDWKISAPPTASSLEDVQYAQKTGIVLTLPELQFQPRPPTLSSTL